MMAKKISIDLQMYPKFKNDYDFVEALLSEQSVFCLPGKCFGVTNLMRIVLTLPPAMTHEAMDRIELFCRQHVRLPSSLEVKLTDSIEDTLNKENKLNGSIAKPAPFKKMSSAGLNAMITNNISNLLSVDSEEAELFMQAFQK